MKIIVAFALVSFAVCVNCVTLAEHKQMVMGIAQECKATEDASDDDLGRLVEKKAPETKEGKCLLTCIIEQMDVIQDGKIDKNGVLEFVSTVTGGDAGKMKVAEEMVATCGAIKDDDRCELGCKIGGCLKMEGMKHKIDFGF